MRRETSAILLLFLAAAAFCWRSGPSLAGASTCYRVVNVDLWDVLYIRSSSDHRSSAVGAVAPDHAQVIRATGPCRPVGASPKRQWCPVDYSPLPGVSKSGFVKAYFVRPVQCPG
jgi:hypothetical protein